MDLYSYRSSQTPKVRPASRGRERIAYPFGPTYTAAQQAYAERLLAQSEKPLSVQS